MHTQPPLNTLPDGSLIDGKFRILRCIGRGGMGAVYEIQHVITKHRRALKLLYPHVVRDRDAVERFLREASVAGTIENPHITETYDAGWLNSGEPYVVMELLDGESLDAWVQRDGKLEVADALMVVAQAAHGVHAAHRAGIVHRDLKPENLFITAGPDGGIFTKILDFGVSKFDDGLAKTRATQDGAFMGTPQYMSPEQFLDGKKVDGRGDLYSLGVILFECLTGTHPYPCETLAELARKIMVEQPVPPSTLRAGIPPKLDAIVARALKKEPADRQHSAEAFGQELEALRVQLAVPGKVTLPHGSRWPSDLPPPQRDHATLKYNRAAGGSEPPRRGPVTQKTGTETVLDASTGSGTVLLSSRAREGSAARWAAPLLLVAAGGGLAAWIWWPPGQTTPTPAASVARIAEPTEAPSSDVSTPESTPSAAATGSAAPTRTQSPPFPSVSVSASPDKAPPTTSSSGSPLPAPKPKDYADVDEFKP